jgi:hypothetical protein
VQVPSRYDADELGWFGTAEGERWGGRFMPEALVAALDELTEAWQDAMADPTFTAELDRMLREYAGTPGARGACEQQASRLALLRHLSPSTRSLRPLHNPDRSADERIRCRRLFARDGVRVPDPNGRGEC